MASYIKGGIQARVVGNRALRRIFRLKMDGNGERRKLQNKEVQSLHRLPNIVRVIKSRLRWTGKVARMEEGMNSFQI